MYRNLLAKGWSPKESPKPPSHARLLPHLRAVQAAGEAIIDSRGPLILNNLGLEREPWLSRLRLAVSLSGLLHDLGKANSYFQGMVRGKADHPPTAQPVRHELLSVLLLLRDSGGIGGWLRTQITEAGQGAVAHELFQTVIAAVAGHHVKMDDEWSKAFAARRPLGGGTELTLYLDHPDLQPLFEGLLKPGDEIWSLLRSAATYPGKIRNAFNEQSVEWQDRLWKMPEWWRFAAAVKALTVAADVAGSALLPEQVGPRKWVKATLGPGPTPEQLGAVATQRLNGRTRRLFQQAIADSQARVTLVEAGCGSGKTVAAYLWAANRCAGRPLFFCYPTTGTATEGFLDYVAGGDMRTDLLHSRASVDLERMAMSRDELPGDESEDEQLRITSLKAWYPEVVVCTVDTVLALVRNNRRGLYSSPAILPGAFVFDEVHAYDEQMFAALIALIRALPGAPFLLMSASLPAAYKDLLHRQVAELADMPPPTGLEAISRYRIEWADSADLAFDEAARRVREGKRVLWVCNIVKRAQALFDRARQAGLPAVTYHSRFKYQDRVERHREVVDGFAAPPGSGLLAVTTQVAEMSLDLDADMLVTELAPASDLIQRLGRLNRRVTEKNPGEPRLALVVRPESEHPYRQNQLNEAAAWLDRLLALGRPLSQKDLADQFRRQADGRSPTLDLKTEWLDSGWCAYPGEVRKGGFNVSVILAEDAHVCRDSHSELIRLSLPVPYRKGMEQWPRLRGTLIAPAGFIHYDTRRGATWAE